MRVVLTNVRTGQQVYCWLGEDRLGVSGPWMDATPAMRLVTRDDVLEGDELTSTAGDRYRITRLWVVKGRRIAEVVKEA